MEKKELKADNLYVLKPSVVLFDDTKSSFRDLISKSELAHAHAYLDMHTSFKDVCKSMIQIRKAKIKSEKELRKIKRAKEANINHLTHIVEFETRIKDTAIGYPEKSAFRCIETNKLINNDIGFHCIEGDLHVGVFPGDIISLARYLWEKDVHDTGYTGEIEKFILSLKPYYTMEELMMIIVKLRCELYLSDNDEPKPFILEKKREEPIFIRNVYTDIC